MYNGVIVYSLLCIGGTTLDGDDRQSSLCAPRDVAGSVYNQLSPAPSFSVVSSCKSVSSTATTATLQPGGGVDGSGVDSGVEVSYQTSVAAAATAGYGGFFDGILGCLRPIWTVIGKATSVESKLKG